MDIRDATKEELEERGESDHGFAVVDEEGDVALLFHWYDEPDLEFRLYPDTAVTPDEYEQLSEEDQQNAVRLMEGINPNELGIRHRTSYAEVLAALPERLDAMGYEDERDALMGEIVGRYGSGS